MLSYLSEIVTPGLFTFVFLSVTFMSFMGYPLASLIEFWRRKEFTSFVYKEGYCEIEREKFIFKWFIRPWILLGSIVIFIMVLIELLYFIDQKDVLLYIILGIIGIVCLIFVPRFVLDLIKSLKFNVKSGEAERIDALEQQIEELKNDKRS